MEEEKKNQSRNSYTHFHYILHKYQILYWLLIILVYKWNRNWYPIFFLYSKKWQNKHKNVYLFPLSFSYITHSYLINIFKVRIFFPRFFTLNVSYIVCTYVDMCVVQKYSHTCRSYIHFAICVYINCAITTPQQRKKRFFLFKNPRWSISNTICSSIFLGELMLRKQFTLI